MSNTSNTSKLKLLSLKERRKEDQKGWAMLVIVIMLGVLGTLAVSEMVITSSITLREANLEFALSWAEETAIGTAAPIRDAIDRHFHRQVLLKLRDHLQKDAQAKQNKQTYLCGQFVSPDAPLNHQTSLCDPEPLLDALRGAENQTIDDLSAIKPDDPKLLKTPEYEQLKYYTENTYKYDLKGVFVAHEVLQAPRQVFPGEEGAEEDLKSPRIDRYRYLARAEIETHTYNDIRYPFTINYDVFATVMTTVTETEPPQCGNEEPGDSGFGGVRFKYVLICKETDRSPHDPNCKEYETCYPTDPCYADYCGSSIPEFDKCENAANGNALSQGDATIPCFTVNGKTECAIEKNVAFVAREYKKTYNSIGCASIRGVIPTRDPRLPGRIGDGPVNSTKPVYFNYEWVTSIRIVGLGTQYY